MATEYSIETCKQLEYYTDDELYIDVNESTCVMDITINTIDYKLLLTLQQMIVLIKIMDNKYISIDDISKQTNIPLLLQHSRNNLIAADAAVGTRQL